MMNDRQLENEYIKKQNPFYIEDLILYSFSKNELKNFISSTEKEYLNKVLPYKHKIGKIIKNLNINNDLEKYFIEQIYFYFGCGFELELTKIFLNRLNRFFKINHTPKQKNSNWVEIDIKSIPITDIIDMYIKIPSNLKRNIKCPLHNDNSPSFKIYEKTNSFYCFGCHKSGNVVNFIAEKEGITTGEAFKKIINLYK